MKKNIYLFQPQYIDFNGGVEQAWLPYASGCLWAYASQFEDIVNEWQLTDLLFSRENISELLNRLENNPPDLCGFSCYQWNINYCLAAAEQIKQRWPNCYIIFGGPQAGVTHSTYEFIDSIVLGEGEETFVQILRSIKETGSVKHIYDKKRLESLEIPSPYAMGLFDGIIENNPKFKWRTVLETNRGCPYACTFCDWGGTTYSKVKKFALDKIQEDLDWIASKPIISLFFGDANFGILKDRDLAIARMLREQSKTSNVVMVTINFAKNSNETIFQIAAELGDLMLQGVTLSVQSMDANVLQNIKRTNMKSHDVEDMLMLSKKYKVPVYSDLILGLPGETLDGWKTGVCELISLGFEDHMEVFFVSLLENAELNTQQKMLYKIKTIKNTCYPGENNSDDISESFDTVYSTSTMTHEQLIEARMYTWMMYHLHNSGFSLLLSRYCNVQCGISYRRFYDGLFYKITTQDSEFNKIYLSAKLEIEELYDDLRHGIFVDAEWCPKVYNIKKDVIDLVFEYVGSLCEVPEEIYQLQKIFTIESDQSYPITVSSSYDIETMLPVATTYKFEQAADRPIYPVRLPYKVRYTKL